MNQMKHKFCDKNSDLKLKIQLLRQWISNLIESMMKWNKMDQFGDSLKL